MENLNLIRKIAHTFSKKSSIQFDDLFQEAAYAYCKALKSYDESKNAKLTTYAYWCMRNHLINFCKKESNISHKNEHIVNRYDNINQYWWRHKTYQEIGLTTQQMDSFSEKIADWPDECKKLANEIIENPEQIIGRTPNFKAKGGPKGRLKRKLRNQGFKWQEIYTIIKQMDLLIQKL